MKKSLLLICVFIVLSDRYGIFAADNFIDRDKSRIAFVGDIYVGGWVEDFILNYGVDYPYRGSLEFLLDADAAVGNLEGPISQGENPFPDKEFLLKMPPGCQAGMAEANLRFLNLANNHILDYGVEGLTETLTALDSSHIYHFGAGIDLTAAFREAVLEDDDQRIAFLGFSTTFPQEFWATDSTPGTAFPWQDRLIESIERCVQTYGIVVVSFHWSSELLEVPKDYQVDLAHLCIDHGADLIIGHHPHIVQSVEIYKGVPIFYSLGNFAFASYSENASVGLAVAVDFDYDCAVSAELIPLNVYNADVLFQPKPLKGKALEEFAIHLQKISQELNEGGLVIKKAGEKYFIPLPQHD